MSKAPKSDNREFSKALQLFFLSFIVIGGLLGSAAFLVYSYGSSEFVGDLLTRESFGVQLRKDVIEDHLDSIVGDLEFLAHQEKLRQYVTSGDLTVLPPLAKDFLAFAQAKAEYDQIRLFDLRGKEIIRINQNNGFPEIVPPERLQNKGKRYYFTDTMVLGRNGIFVSPMDLNVEKGKVEVPYKPMIRFGMPLYGTGDTPVGAVIINYKADKLLGMLRKTGTVSVGQTMLLNPNGYWLLAPDSKDQWGFMFPDKSSLSFGSRYPKQWTQVHSRESGQIVTADKIFTFTTIYPLNRRLTSSTGSKDAYGQSEEVFPGDRYYWKMVSFVPDAKQQGYFGWVLDNLFSIGALIVLCTGAVAWLAAYMVVRRRLSNSLKLAVPIRDPLTGLANHLLYGERVEQALRDSGTRGRFSLMRIRVDDLDAINNNYGKEVGDGLLLQIGLRLKGSFNPIDTVARLGGAEFVVLLKKVRDRESLDEITARARKVLGEPFTLYKSEINLAMTVTSGLHPEDGATPDRLLEKLRSL